MTSIKYISFTALAIIIVFIVWNWQQIQDAADIQETNWDIQMDADGDGVPDSMDMCPDSPGNMANNGCPESNVNDSTDVPTNSTGDLDSLGNDTATSHEIAVLTFYAKVGFSLIFLLSALFVILSNKYDENTKKWAFSVLALIAGVWIGSAV